jgi:hypothetical protein
MVAPARRLLDIAAYQGGVVDSLDKGDAPTAKEAR